MCPKCGERPDAWKRKSRGAPDPAPPSPPPRTARLGAEEKARQAAAAEREKMQRIDEAAKAAEAQRLAYVPTAGELLARKLKFDGVYVTSVDALCKLLTSRRGITEALTQEAIDEFYVAVRAAPTATKVLEGHVTYASERTRVVVEAFGDDEATLQRIFGEVFKRLQGITAPGETGCCPLASDNVKLQSKGMPAAAASIAILDVGAHFWASRTTTWSSPRATTSPPPAPEIIVATCHSLLYDLATIMSHLPARSREMNG